MQNVQVIIRDPRLKDSFLSQGSADSAGYDLRASLEQPVVIMPGEVELIDTGLSVYIGDPNIAATILPRSGLGHKNGIVLGNLVGLIDADYQGNLMMSVWNRSDRPYTIDPLDRVAQLVFLPIIKPTFNVVESFNEASVRGEGGFGHSGHQ